MPPGVSNPEGDHADPGLPDFQVFISLSHLCLEAEGRRGVEEKEDSNLNFHSSSSQSKT